MNAARRLQRLTQIIDVLNAATLQTLAAGDEPISLDHIKISEISTPGESLPEFTDRRGGSAMMRKSA